MPLKRKSSELPRDDSKSRSVETDYSNCKRNTESHDSKRRRRTESEGSSPRKSSESENSKHKSTESDRSKHRKSTESDHSKHKKSTESDHSKQRKNTQSVDSKRKRAELENSRAEDEIDFDIEALNLVRAGAIIKVYMQNFMCHSSFEVELNSNVNFIVGRNGSGKSAVLTAVIVAFGGKASTTNRAASLKDLVKKGSRSAFIEITVSNVGMYSYKQAEYGNHLIISRRIYSDNTPSVYRIKSERGEIIATKREDLVKIVSAFNIQVDNPISVLNQDNARTFLTSYDPKSMYSLFMKATRLEDVSALYSQIWFLETKLANVWRTRRNTVRESEKELKEIEKKCFALQKLDSIRERIEKLENELFWAMVHEKEKILTKEQEKHDKENNILTTKGKEIDKCKAEKQAVLNDLECLEAKQEELIKKMNDKRGELSVAKSKEKQCKVQYISKLEEYKAIKKKASQHSIDIQALKKEIEKIQSVSDAVVISQRREIQDRLAALTKELEDIVALQSSSENDYHNMKGAENYYREQQHSVNMERETVRNNIETKQKQLRLLQSQSSNLTVYGDWMPALIRKINEAFAAKKFVRKPLGPIGTCLKLRDEKWATAIESNLGSAFLKSFCCHCADDAVVLQSLMKEVSKQDRLPGIFVSLFADKVYNIQEYRPVAPGCVSMYDMLIITEPNIANCLIDQRGVESILLIPTSEMAYDIMSNKHKVPKNCRRGLSMNGHLFYPAPNYKSYHGNTVLRARFLQVSMKEILNNLQEDVKNDTQHLKSLELKLKEIDDKIKTNTNEIRKIERKMNVLSGKKIDISSQMKDLKDRLEPERSNINTLYVDLEELEKELKEITDDERRLDQDSSLLNENIKHAAKEVTEASKDIEKIEQEKHKLLVEITTVKEKVQRINNKLNNLEDVCKNTKSKIQSLNVVLAEQKEKVEKAVSEASKLCPRINTRRRLEEINDEIVDAKDYVNNIEEETGSHEELVKVLEEKRTKYMQNARFMRKLLHGLKALVYALVLRKTKVYGIVLKLTVLKVMYMFQPLLLQRNYKGCIIFEHEQGTLHVVATPAKEDKIRETKSLSGGERSYATVAFILSIWACIDNPFYFLDEFDVFMDKVNRSVIMELLVLHAKKRNYQYIFLTPQDTKIKSDEKISILKLDDPERSARE